MKHSFASSIILLIGFLVASVACAQKPPASPSQPWQGAMQTTAPARSVPAFVPDPGKIYTLPELIDLAERNNPDTRVAWETAKARAADLGISKATLYPTIAAAVTAQTVRTSILFNTAYVRQTLDSFAPAIELEYTVFDFGRRLDEIAVSRYNLLAANLLFNDTHRKVIYQVMAAYYRVLNAKGQEEAAEANLKNAQTVQQDAEARLALGLSTLPDVLEARSAAAQADYDLQAALGASEIAHGDLATSLGISPTAQFQVESIRSLTIPQDLTVTVENAIDKALAQRPDLMQRVAELRAAGSELKAAKTAYLPTLSFEGDAGINKTYGWQDQLPSVYSPNQEFWTARLSLTWTLFDGLARENRIAKAKAEQKEAAAEIDAVRDQVENEVWTAYSTARTALRQQKAAAALLESASSSYDAALQSYNLGVRSQIDVVSAQRTLAAARTADVSARTQLLTGIAALAFQTGDLLHTKGP
ncbi:MAG: TolC family protein [Acidobacteriaceae bacterium]